MSTIRPEQINQTGVFIPEVDPQTGERIPAGELLSKLGKLGYVGSVVEPFDRTAEKLLPHNPETDGSLGTADFEEFVAFVEAQGSKSNMATRVWGRLVSESGWRATNNRFFEDSAELRAERDAAIQRHNTTMDTLHRRLLDDESHEEAEAAQAEIKTERERNHEEMRELDERLLHIYYNIGDRQTVDDRIAADYSRHIEGARYIQNTAARLRDTLVDPTEAGEPFAYKKQDEGGMAVVYYYHSPKGKDLKGTVLRLDEAYRVLAKQLDSWPWHDITQRLPQLAIRFFNHKIHARQSSDTAE